MQIVFAYLTNRRYLTPPPARCCTLVSHSVNMPLCKILAARLVPLCAYTPFSLDQYLSIAREHGVVRTTGTTQRIATPAKQDRVTAVANMQENLAKTGRV